MKKILNTMMVFTVATIPGVMVGTLSYTGTSDITLAILSTAVMTALTTLLGTMFLD